jgi:ribosomal protein L1
MVEKSVLIDALKKAKEQAPERKFTESVDMTINLKNIDMSQPKNRIDETILLPHGNGRAVKIAVLGSGDIVTQAGKPVLNSSWDRKRLSALEVPLVKHVKLHPSISFSWQKRRS